MRRRIALVVIGVGVALLGCAGTTVGQGFQGGLRGSIKDAGGAVAGAAVTLTNEATSLSRSAVTNAEGEYAFASVEPGTYSVKVSMQGYQTAERIGVRVGTQSFLVLDQTLELGTISESVTVSVQTPLVETANAKAPVREVPILADGTHDLKAMAAAGATTGLAFVCNPNNPTGGINRGTAVREFMTAFRTAAPEAYVLVDEAYYDYVTDWSYETAVPFTQNDKRILVSRTFSKIHGMAGLRVGYAIGHPETLGQVRAMTSAGTLSSVSAGAALASLADQAHLSKQKVLNAEARTYTRTQFEKAGFTVLPSEGNFVMVDVRRPSAEFQELCRDAGISVARAFPPMTTYSRITIGTVEEMKKAVALMMPLLTAPAKPKATTPAASRPADAGLWLIEHDHYSC